MKPGEKKKDEMKAADEKKSDRVITPNDDPSGAKFDGNVDVSDATMAKLNADIKAGRGQEKVAGKEESAEHKDEKNGKSDESNDEDKLDAASEAILNEIASAKEAESKKAEGQTPEQKNAELERKNKELYAENKSLKTKPAESTASPEKPMTDEEKEAYAEWIKKEFDMPMDEYLRQLNFYKRANAEFIDPRFSGIDKKFSDSELKKQLGNNKLYNALKDEVDEAVKTDTRLQNLPKEVAYSLALDIVQKNNMPKIAKVIAERESARTKLNKRVILNDRSTVSTDGKKEKSDINIDNVAKDNMNVLKIDESDLKKYGGKSLVLE